VLAFDESCLFLFITVCMFDGRIWIIFCLREIFMPCLWLSNFEFFLNALGYYLLVWVRLLTFGPEELAL